MAARLHFSISIAGAAVFGFASQSKIRQHELLDYFNWLEARPEMTNDPFELDDAGRPVYVGTYKNLFISYQFDHAERILRILEISRISRVRIMKRKKSQ